MVIREEPPDPSPPTRWWIALVYLILFAFSVPWYLPATGDSEVPLWLGLPYWVVLSIAGNVAVAAFTAFVVTRYWPEDVASSTDGVER